MKTKHILFLMSFGSVQDGTMTASLNADEVEMLGSGVLSLRDKEGKGEELSGGSGLGHLGHLGHE